MIKKLLGVVALLLCFNCRLGTPFTDEVNLNGSIRGKIKKPIEGTFGIEGIAYPNLAGSGFDYKGVKYTIQTPDTTILETYYASQENFRFIFRIQSVGAGDWGTVISIVSY